MVNLAISDNTVLELVEQLPEPKKEVLFEQLQDEFLKKRWKALIERIEERKKIYPITDEEIEEEVNLAREEFHKNRR